MVVELLDGYRTPGAQTDLASLATHCQGLPCEPGALFRVVQGLVVHESAFKRSGLSLAPGQHTDRDIRADEILEQALRLDPAPLSEPRPLERRLVGECFHSALLYCALLRHCGFAARARCGFASYLEPGAWVDHWVTERWDGGRWVRDDTDAGRHDLGPDAFRSAGRAWLACRRSGDDPGHYGIGPLWGWPELRGSLICDAAALNKEERFTWGRWELAIPPSTPEAREDLWLDRLAELTVDDELLTSLRQTIEANPAFSRARISPGE